MIRKQPTSLLTAVILLGASLTALGQDHVPGRHYPLDHRQATGIAGRWSALTKPDFQGYFQPVRVALPVSGEVAFYQGSPQNPVPLAAPAQVGLAPGYTYRIKLSGLQGHPGIELYPTIELIDRLHAPEGLTAEFPVPIEITAEEIELALQDRLVTKVIYVEQPDLAPPLAQEGGIRTEKLPATANLLEAADARGRPIAILRIGGRIPDPNSPVDEFHSTAPLTLPASALTSIGQATVK